MAGILKGKFRAAKAEIKQDVRKAKEVKRRWDILVERLALVGGISGFVALGALMALWVWNFVSSSTVPRFISPSNYMNYGVAALFASSFIGWLLVIDGEDLISKRTGHRLAIVFFFLLPLICLVAKVFPSKTALIMGFPSMDGHPTYPFWLFVRFYPMLLVFTCLAIAFKSEAKARKHIQNKKAAKFLLLATPYIILVLFQEFSVKEEVVSASLSSTLGVAGIDIQLMLAVLMGSRLD